MGDGTYAELDKENFNRENKSLFKWKRDFLNVTFQKEGNYAFA